MAQFCICPIQLVGRYDDLLRSGVPAAEAKNAAKSAYQPWRDRLVTIDQMITVSSYNVKLAFDHVLVCQSSISGADLWWAFWNHACNGGKREGLPSDTMLKSMKTAARKIKDPGVNAFLAALQVQLA